MAASANDRTKASKIRAKRADKVTAKERAWLAAYDARKGTSAKAKTKTAPATGGMSSFGATLVAPPQASAAPAPVIHETRRLDDTIDPSAFTFKPLVLEPGADTPPPAPGMPAPPAPGTPLIDGPSASEVAAASSAMDAEAAKLAASKARAKVQFRMIVLGVCMGGVKAARELFADDDSMPDMVRAALANPSQGLAFVGDACDGVSDKYGFKSIPGGDEAVVGGAVLASAFAYLAVQKKRKQRKPNAATSPTTNAETSAHDPAPAPPPAAATSGSVAAFTGDDR